MTGTVRVPRRGVGALAALAVVLAGCTGDGASTGDDGAATTPVAPSTTRGAAPDTGATSAPTAAPDDGEALSQRVADLVAEMTLAEKAGQVIVATYAGAAPPVDLVVDHHLGGVIVMADNMGSTTELAASNEALAQAVADSGRQWPVFIGVDQEGGTVERAKGDLTRWPSFMSYGAADDGDLTRRAAQASGGELRSLGFTVVFAPVADVTIGTADPIIRSRSAGGDPELVAEHAVAAAQGYLDAGVMPVLKHFPGHGSVTVDSHVDLPVQDRTVEELRGTDWVPFAAGVEAGLPSVMVGHIALPDVGADLPASVEPEVIDGLLRDDLGFEGLVVTDAMNMGAVTAGLTTGEAAVRTLQAGADVVLMPADTLAARDAIVAAVEEGSLSETRLDEAVGRQLEALLEVGSADAEAVEPGTSEDLAQEVSAAAVAQVSGECGVPLVGDSVSVRGPDEAVARFEEAAAAAGLATGSGPTVALAGPGAGAATADVVVALDTPYVLGPSTAWTAKLALFGDTPGAMRALVDVLLGEAPAPGQLPVDVVGLDRGGCDPDVSEDAGR